MCSARHKRICCTHVQTWVTVCHWLKIKIVLSWQKMFHLHVSPKMSHAHSSSSSCLHMSVPPLTLFSSTSSTSQVTLPINEPCAQDPQNEEYGSVAKTTASTGYEPNVIDNFDYSETYTAIFQNESVDRHGTVVLVRCGTRRWAYQKSAIFTTVYSGARRTSELGTNLSLSWRKFVTSSVLFHPNKNGETRVRTKFKFVSKTETKSRPGKRANQDSPWKTQRANSCWSQIWDPEARTSSRVRQKKYPGINWNYWFSANGNWSYYYRVWAIQARSITTSRRNVRTKSGSSWNLYQEYAWHGRIAEKSRVKGRGTFKKKLTEDFEAVTSFFHGSNVKTVYNFGDNDVRCWDLTTSTPGIRWLDHCTFRSEKQVRACSQVYHSQRESLFQRAQSVFSKYGETRYWMSQKAQM